MATETLDPRDDALERAIASYRDAYLAPAPEPSEAMAALLGAPRTPAAPSPAPPPASGPRLRVLVGSTALAVAVGALGMVGELPAAAQTVFDKVVSVLTPLERGAADRSERSPVLVHHHRSRTARHDADSVDSPGSTTDSVPAEHGVPTSAEPADPTRHSVGNQQTEAPTGTGSGTHHGHAGPAPARPPHDSDGDHDSHGGQGVSGSTKDDDQDDPADDQADDQADDKAHDKGTDPDEGGAEEPTASIAGNTGADGSDGTEGSRSADQERSSSGPSSGRTSDGTDDG